MHYNFLFSVKRLLEYATVTEEQVRAEEDENEAVATGDTDQRNKHSGDDVTDDVMVTSDGGKRRNKTWRRPATDGDNRKQKSSESHQNYDGMSGVHVLRV